MKTMNIELLVTITLMLVLTLAAGSAQAGELSSDFQGRVVDAQGHAVQGATIVVTHVETGRITRHTSGSTGRWHALGKRSDGTYRVSCFAPGADAPTVSFVGQVRLGQVHTRNCVLGTVDSASPAWLSSWSWKQGPGDRYVQEAS